MANKKISKDVILNDGELLIRTMRRSWLKLLGAIILPLIIIIADFFFLFRLMFYWANVGLVVFLTILLIGVFWLARCAIVWYYQVFIITSQRIFDIDQKGIFKKTVSSVPLIKIQDVFYEVSGAGQTLTKTGNVSILVADGKTKIEVKNISEPQRIQQLILRLKEDTMQEKLETTELSAKELIELVKKIKAGIGEKKFEEIINLSEKDSDDEVEAET